jgi:hypothetical protein
MEGQHGATPGEGEGVSVRGQHAADSKTADSR